MRIGTTIQVAVIGLSLAARAAAAVVPPAGYLYSPQVLGSLTQSCIAVGPGGTFVGVGPGFTANAQAVVFVQESGATRLVALGFNSISDCLYDAANDVLYVSDNAGAVELAAALTGDTVFRIPSASTASALPALGLELLPENAVPAAAGLALDAAANLYVGNATGGGAGEVVKVTLPAVSPALFATGLDFIGGLAIDGSGDLFVGDTRSCCFDARVSRFDSSGAPEGVFAAPSFDFGSYDLALLGDGRLLASGAFGGDVVAFDALGTPAPFIGGLTFATGLSVNGFTGRVEVLSSTFVPTDEDRTIHRFTPIEALVPGKGSPRSECLHEFYGAELVPPAPSKPATQALCTDGDACDADGAVNDRCLFPIGFCLNVPDPRFPDCASTGIASFSARVSPNGLDGAHALAALQAALPSAAPGCFFSDGVVVPVKIAPAGKKSGKGKVVIKATGSSGDVDSDTLSLVCNPAP